MKSLKTEIPKKGAHLYKHGLSGSPEYNAWTMMKRRCYNVKNKRYPEWGGRGIMVCDKWLNDFMAFFNDMGVRPSDAHSLDRKDNNGNYEQSNCRWATKEEQSTNRPSWVNAIEFEGCTLTMTQWAEKVGISRKTLYDRFKNGWLIKDALTTPKLPSGGGSGVVERKKRRNIVSKAWNKAS